MTKSFFALLFLACVCTLPIKAQKLDAHAAIETTKDYLIEEGYQPTVDADGDVTFKVRGYRYYVHISGMNDGSLLTYFYTLFNTDRPYQHILEACNTCNSKKNVVKYYALRGEDGTVSYRIGIETFCNTGDEFLSQIADAMQIMPDCVDEFIEAYED